MSASATALAQKLPRDSSLPPRDPAKLRLLEWAVGLPALALVCTLTALHWNRVAGEVLTLLPWAGLVCVVDLIPLRYASHLLTMSIAVLLAAGMVFSPAEAGLLAFVG